MKIKITEQQLNNFNILYTAIFVEKDVLKEKYPPIHINEFYHHITLEFKPKDVTNIPFGEKTKVKIIGRLTTDKVDALLVECPYSKNIYPHITLSTAEGIKPVASNDEIIKNKDKIISINDSIHGIFGFFDGSKIVTDINFI